jgi:hypothetical protein
MAISLEADFDTWNYVLVAVELRILDLQKVASKLDGDLPSFCQEQLDGLEAFAINMRKKFHYATQLNKEDRS